MAEREEEESPREADEADDGDAKQAPTVADGDVPQVQGANIYQKDLFSLKKRLFKSQQALPKSTSKRTLRCRCAASEIGLDMREFCIECEQSVCGECAAQHKAHRVESVKAASSHYEQELRKKLVTCDAVERKLREAVSNVSAAIEADRRDSTDQRLQSITTAFDRLKEQVVQMLLARQQDITEKYLHIAHPVSLKELESEQQDLQDVTGVVSSCRAECQEVLNEKDEGKRVIGAAASLRKLTHALADGEAVVAVQQRVVSPPTADVSFDYSEDELAELEHFISSFGRLKTRKDDPSSQSAPSQ